jgi:hypothetical protein
VGDAGAVTGDDAAHPTRARNALAANARLSLNLMSPPVGLRHSPACTSNAPMSQGVSGDVCTTGRGPPRWSVVRVQLMAGTASMAGLPGSRAWVSVSPPCSRTGQRLDSRLEPGQTVGIGRQHPA